MPSQVRLVEEYDSRGEFMKPYALLEVDFDRIIKGDIM